MKKTNIKTKVIAGIMAAICSVSAIGAISAVSASAAVTNEAAISAQAKNAKACIFTAYGKTSYGYDWDYRADSTAAKISCSSQVCDHRRQVAQCTHPLHNRQGAQRNRQADRQGVHHQ